MNDEDGRLLEKLLRAQSKDPMVYPLDASERKALQHHRVRRADGEIVVTVPENAPPLEAAPTEPRESIGVQALLAEIGARMGFRVWIPQPDRAQVLKEAPRVE